MGMRIAIGFDESTVLHDPPSTQASNDERLTMSEPTSDFLREFIARGYFHQCTDLEALDALARKGRIVGYIGFDATAEFLHVGNLVQIMLLRRLQQHGPSADRAHGRRHHQDRRSLGQGREPQAAERGGYRLQHRRHPPDLHAIPQLRRRPERCRHGQQRRLARRPRLYPLPARLRPPLLGQPHARLRQRQAAAGARAAADLPRVQLHDPPGLRLPGARAGATTACCRWAAPTSGATSSTASSSAGGSTTGRSSA